LAVRGHDRYQCELSALISISPEHSKLIKVDKSAPGGGGPASAVIVDLSMGGVGLRAALFVPLTCRLVINLAAPGKPEAPMHVRVQRVSMLDRTPMYYLGTSFENPTPEQIAAVSALLNHLKATGARLVPEKQRA
jgi:hypothetical protein